MRLRSTILSAANSQEWYCPSAGQCSFPVCSCVILYTIKPEMLSRCLFIVITKSSISMVIGAEMTDILKCLLAGLPSNAGLHLHVTVWSTWKINLAGVCICIYEPSELLRRERKHLLVVSGAHVVSTCGVRSVIWKCCLTWLKRSVHPFMRLYVLH